MSLRDALKQGLGGYAALSVATVAALIKLFVESAPSTVVVPTLAIFFVGFVATYYFANRERVGGFDLDYVYPTSASAQKDIVKAIRSASGTVRMLGISHRSLESGEMPAAVAEFCRGRSATLEIFFLSPDSRHVAVRAQDEGQGAAWFSKSIEQGIAWVADLERRMPGHIKAFAYDEYPSWRVVAIERHTMFVGFYPAQGRGMESPLMRIRFSDRDASLFNAFMLTLDLLRSRSRPLPLL